MRGQSGDCSTQVSLGVAVTLTRLHLRTTMRTLAVALLSVGCLVAVLPLAHGHDSLAFVYDVSSSTRASTTVPSADLGAWAVEAPRSDAGFVYDSAPCLNATNGQEAVSDDALAYATRAEKLDHLFMPEHNLDPLVAQIGIRKTVVEQMRRGVSGETPAAGVFELTTTIEGQAVVARGAVVGGVVKIGKAFIP